ncbi:hypothetical protein L6452_03813 [Arctium lappa]|uniref:Uncharacterized protein n=1 Tax=Arctium lappa TaxID=4217 RepID=A0ACB9FP99_ARCLA|nr:hypothetical protein L6452_03813 [Arctium lappa]
MKSDSTCPICKNPYQRRARSLTSRFRCGSSSLRDLIFMEGVTIINRLTPNSANDHLKLIWYWECTSSGYYHRLGYCALKVLSNDKYKSILHQTVVNCEKERISIPTFYCQSPDVVIGSASELVTDDLPACLLFTGSLHMQNTAISSGIEGYDQDFMIRCRNYSNKARIGNRKHGYVHEALSFVFGDTANKIRIYTLVLYAKHHDIMFLSCGDEIVIEERSAKELLNIVEVSRNKLHSK